MTFPCLLWFYCLCSHFASSGVQLGAYQLCLSMFCPPNFLRVDMSNFPIKCMVEIIYLWTSVDVYDFTHLLLESYCSLRNCIVLSVVGILAATVLELDQTLMPIISKHNNHFLMSVFTNRIDIEIYLECGISLFSSA